MAFTDFRTTRNALLNGQTTLPEVVESFLSTIEKTNKDINSFVAVYPEQALEKAKEIQKKLDNGQAGALAGAVMGIKDVITEKGKQATCASNYLRNYEAVYDATVIERLKNADAVFVGRLNMDEFAMGSSNENSIFGATKNPHDTTRVPGGSSGASAASVAANQVNLSLGSDTGGSIRQPAAYCGVVGVKPTYGRVSRYGLIAYASSFDSIGPLAHSVADTADALHVIAGRDANDGTSADVAVPNFNAIIDSPDSNIKIGVPAEYFGEGLDPEIKSVIEGQLQKLASNGAELIPIHLPHSAYAIATYYILATAEASSNLARFDGVRYGHRTDMKVLKEQLAAEAQQIKERIKVAGGSTEELDQALKGIDSALVRMYKQSRTEGFGAEVKRRIMLGTYVLSAGYYDAYYGKAQKIRRLISNDFKDAFSKVDVIVSPTAPTTAFKIGSNIDDPVQMYLNDIYTISANLAGICGISVPVTNHSADAMPIGIQFMADVYREDNLFRAGRLVELTR
ncbi:Asp-tRNA(Asn)/Glu-tRNA(Gln) amidotransferase subunit GatA [bacterium]|nr:MAG: Asp-tRNA(Asn)/Glu-tRNA(Gln) amidotransferase subunit GatA [bacterium]